MLWSCIIIIGLWADVVSKSMVCRLTFCIGLSLGVAYRMDKLRGNCSVTPIAGSDFDAHSLDATTVRIRTAKEFFYFDKTQYAYEGVVSMFIVSFKLNCYIGKIPSFLGPFTICLYIKIAHIPSYSYNMSNTEQTQY